MAGFCSFQNKECVKAFLRYPPPLSTDWLVHRPLGGRTVSFGTTNFFSPKAIFFENSSLNIHENGLEMCNFFYIFFNLNGTFGDLIFIKMLFYTPI